MIPVPVAELLERLSRADELETAERVARARGLTVAELLERRGPRHPLAGAIVDLYVALQERGRHPPTIARLTGRGRETVIQGLKYRLDPGYRASRRQRAKQSYGGGAA